MVSPPPLPTLPTIRLSTVCISCEWWWSFLCSWTQLLAFTDWMLLWWKNVIPVPKHQVGTTFSLYVAVVVIWWPCSLDCIPCCGDKECKTLLTGRSLLPWTLWIYHHIDTVCWVLSSFVTFFYMPFSSLF